MFNSREIYIKLFFLQLNELLQGLTYFFNHSQQALGSTVCMMSRANDTIARSTEYENEYVSS